MSSLSFIKNSLLLLKQKYTPVQKDRILFTSFNGHYSDNPKYLSEAIHRLDPCKELVWLVQKQYLPLLPPYVRGIDISDSKAVQKMRGTAVAIIDNVYGDKEQWLSSSSKGSKLKFALTRRLKDKPGQQVFTTWHGTPLKCMGRDQVGSSVLNFSCPRTTMILGNQYTLDIMQRLTFYRLQMELIGTPRNDLLFASKEQTEPIKTALELPPDKKIILFAPTFRNDGNKLQDTNLQRSGLNQLKEMDFGRLFQALSHRFGGDWALVCRFHYHVEQQVNWEELNQKYPGRIINGNLHDDMAQYLACTELLLTDASSSMFDFALTGRPCLLFFPDLEHYATRERGFYTPIDQLPFPAAVDFPELLKKIQTFDAEEYTTKTKKMLENYGFTDDENSSARVANYILTRI
ncbi:MAG: CDP-glycerol glycerophosphotransferase family protein, partial [Clostridia bacterium]|nr:CDP-glycerol glycerophosphotransferase family protein [Clostridia bacterium]